MHLRMCHHNLYELYKHTYIKLTAYFESRCQTFPLCNALSFSGCETKSPSLLYVHSYI